MTKPYPGTQAVLRAVALLKVFDDAHPEWALNELAQKTGLNKTTAFRLLSALESEGLVARGPGGETYTLGPEIAVLGGRALRRNNLRTVTRPELEALAAATGETASLEILADDEILIIDEVLGEHLLSGTQSLGTRWPIHATSTGLALLAFMRETRRERLLQRPLLPVTSHTITDLTALRAHLEQIRAQGYAAADEMLELGLVAIGAPLYNHDGQVVAAISVFGPKLRLTSERIPVIGRLLQETAVRISAQLGYKPIALATHPIHN
jgi:IclR family transcriptional regulator, acetate operon repressor